MITRRAFITATAAGGLTAVLSHESPGQSSQAGQGYFAVHPMVEQSPDAVFIMRTGAKDKFDTDAKKRAGLDFSRSVFVPSETPGIPLSRRIALKTNTILGKAKDPYPEGYLMGAHTDPWFTEGVIEGMKELGLAGEQFYLRDASCRFRVLEESGYVDMARRVGANLLETTDVRDGEESIHWVDIPGGVIHRRIPYLRPYNEPDTFLLNIAKFKSHAMGLTLCCKNLQGTIAHPYQGFCGGLRGPVGRCDKDTLNRKYRDIVEKNHKRHVAEGIPRWDKPGVRGYDCGIGMETWATRTLDNLTVTKSGLCVVEGIYGRDGSHTVGPHPPYNRGKKVRGRAKDFMSNIIIFGMNPFHVDIIGHWLGGHEPGNFGLFHLALERGMSRFLDPREIPLYRWENGKAVSASLDSFERTPLLTYYLARNYNGGDEEVYHMCDEPYDYSG